MFEDKQVLLSEKDKLSNELSVVKKLPPLVSETEEIVLQWTIDHSPHTNIQLTTEYNEENQRPSQRNPWLVQPPRIKEIRSCVDMFSGRKGDNNFSLWLADSE